MQRFLRATSRLDSDRLWRCQAGPARPGPARPVPVGSPAGDGGALCPQASRLVRVKDPHPTVVWGREKRSGAGAATPAARGQNRPVEGAAAGGGEGLHQVEGDCGSVGMGVFCDGRLWG
jgi:hypothetical protein